MTEIIMEQYPINPILKDNVHVIYSQELQIEEIQQINQGNHPCEEELRLYYSSEDTKNITFITKTPFDETPINVAEIRQLVKYQY